MLNDAPSKIKASIPNKAATRLGWGFWLSSLALLLILIVFTLFLTGIYDPLFWAALLSLIILPVALIGGVIICIHRRRWLAIAFGLLIPPAWITTLLAAMSDYPHYPDQRLFQALVLASGPIVCWLFLSVALGRPKPMRNSA